MMNKEHAHPLAWTDVFGSVAFHAALLFLVAFLIVRAPKVGVEAANITAEFQLFESPEVPSSELSPEPAREQSTARECGATAEIPPTPEPIPPNSDAFENVTVESHPSPVDAVHSELQPAPSEAPKVSHASRSARTSSRASSPINGAREALPDYLRNPPPAYPESSRLAREEGVVMLLVDVGSSGTPTDVRLQRSSGHSSLDQAAIRAVRCWKFRPGTMVGMAVASSVSIPVRFELH